MQDLCEYSNVLRAYCMVCQYPTRLAQVGHRIGPPRFCSPEVRACLPAMAKPKANAVKDVKATEALTQTKLQSSEPPVSELQPKADSKAAASAKTPASSPSVPVA